MKRLTFAAVLMAAVVTFEAQPAQAQTARLADSDIVEAYPYLLGRWLILRQEAMELKDGFKWNEIIHREPTGLNGAYPDPDTVVSEAWIAVDETSCTIIDIPEIKDRYYTIQIMNGWGEVTNNLNERNIPKHPWGRFALCLKDAKITLPRDPPPPRAPRQPRPAQPGSKPGAQPAAAPPPPPRPPILRVDLPNKKSRLIVRIETIDDPAGTIGLQKRITLRTTGTPKIDKAVAEPNFSNKKLPSIEGFDKTEEILASEEDINSGMVAVREIVRAIGRAAANPAERARVDDVIQKRAIPKFLADLPNMGRSMNGWLYPNNVGKFRTDYQTRAATNLNNIWANSTREMVFFTMQGVEGSRIYTQTWKKDALPETKAKYFWSIAVVDDVDHRIIRNPQNRNYFNNQSNLKTNDDGSLTLAFAPRPPPGVPESNWLPTPQGRKYNLMIRFFGPTADAGAGQWYPPVLVRGR